MDKQTLISLALAEHDVFVDHPFHTRTIRFTTIRHKHNNKILAMIYEKKGHLYLDLKCDKNKISDLVEFNSHIYYGAHMNKNHWITIEIDGAMPNSEVKKLIRRSYELTH